MSTSKIVTQRFVKCHNTLKELNIIRSSRQFAMELDYLPQSLSEILKGRRDVTIELLRKAIEVYAVNPNYIFLGQEPIFTNTDGIDFFSSETKEEDSPEVNTINYISKERESSFFEHDFYSETTAHEDQLLLPSNWLKKGDYFCFDVSDDAMEPTIYRDDKIVCKKVDTLENYDNLTGGRLYVFGLKDRLIIRRFHYVTTTTKKIVLTTDSLSQTPVEWDFADFKIVWRVYYIMSRKNTYRKTPNLGLHEEIKNLREQVVDITKQLSALTNAIQQLKIK